MKGKNKGITKTRDGKECRQNTRRRQTGNEGEDREAIKKLNGKYKLR
jgi:hypothetical protein